MRCGDVCPSQGDGENGVDDGDGGGGWGTTGWGDSQGVFVSQWGRDGRGGLRHWGGCDGGACA